LTALRSRPALADPLAAVGHRQSEVDGLRDRARRCLAARLGAADEDLAHRRARVAALSPVATLARGYAVVQRADGTVVRRPTEVAPGDPLRIRLAAGTVAAEVRAAAQREAAR
jgi:exodeoxyribonuclease VII large subunit